MKRTGTKIIAVITALVFMMGLFPVSAGAAETYHIEYQDALADGGGTVSGPEQAKAGDTVTLNVNAAEGYELQFLEYVGGNKVVDIDIINHSFVMPEFSVTVYYSFRKTSNPTHDPITTPEPNPNPTPTPDPNPTSYNVTYSAEPSNGGSVSGTLSANEGDTVTFTVTPNDGYKLESLKAVEATINQTELMINGNTFTMPNCDVNVTATFRKTRHDLTYAASPVGGGSVSGPRSANEGETVTLTVTPKDGYELKSFIPVSITYTDTNGVPKAVIAKQDSHDPTKFTFPMPAADTEVTATFNEIADYAYDVAVDSSIQNGTVMASCAKAANGTEVTLTATPNEGYELKSLKAVNTYTEEELTITDNKFTMPAGNVKVSAEFAKKAQFTGHNLLLSSEIGVMFKVTLPDGADTTKSYMSFAYSDGRTSVTQNITDAEKVDDENAYWFTCFINPLELSDKITATFYGDGKTIVNEFSAMDYITYVTTNYTERTQLVALVKALQNFGYYMQNSGWTDDNTHTAIAAVTELAAADLTAAKTGVEDMAVVKDLEGSGISESGASFYLTLNSDTVINLLIKPDDGVTISESQTYETVTGDDNVIKYKFTSDKIGAANLDKFYTFKIATDQGTATIKACAMSYVHAILNSSTAAEGQKYAMTAYYNYHIAAEAFVASRAV